MISEHSEFSSLREWMRSQPGVQVAVVAGKPEHGELGALDVLTLLASSAGAVAAVRTLPDFIRSRRSGIRVETTIRGQRFVLDATNVEEILPLLERLLDE